MTKLTSLCSSIALAFLAFMFTLASDWLMRIRPELQTSMCGLASSFMHVPFALSRIDLRQCLLKENEMCVKETDNQASLLT